MFIAALFTIARTCRQPGCPSTYKWIEKLRHIYIQWTSTAAAAAAAAKLLQSCLTLCDPIDSSPLGFPVPGISQARILEWVAIAFSRRSSRPRDQTQGSNPGLPYCGQMLYRVSHQGSVIFINKQGKLLIKITLIQLHNFRWTVKVGLYIFF